MVNSYNVYGITLISELALNLPAAKGSGDVVVELRLAGQDTLRTLTSSLTFDRSDWVQHAVLQDGSVYMRWEEWVEFLVSADGKLVRWNNLSNEAPEFLEAYLVNFAVSAALLQQGEEPLHSTVVDFGGRAIGLVGASGAGKSTLAAHLLTRGGKLLTDDMLRITFQGDRALAHPGPQRLKLFEESAERYLPNAVSRGRFNPLSGKLLFQPEGQDVARNAQPLSALFSLGWPSDSSEPHRVSIARLRGLDLFKTISSSTMNSRVNSIERLQRQLMFAERLAGAVPVYSLTYDRSYEFLQDVGDHIIDVVSEPAH